MAIKQVQWLTYEEVQRDYEKSERTMRRYAQAGRVRSKEEIRDGRRMTLFHAGDLEQLKHDPGAAEGNGLSYRAEAPGGRIDSHHTPRMLPAPESSPPRNEEVSWLATPWISIQTAVKISGLKESIIRELMQEGKLRSIGHREPRLLRREVLAFEGEPGGARKAHE